MATFFNNKYIQIAAITVYMLTMCCIALEVVR